MKLIAVINIVKKILPQQTVKDNETHEVNGKRLRHKQSKLKFFLKEIGREREAQVIGKKLRKIKLQRYCRPDSRKLDR